MEDKLKNRLDDVCKNIIKTGESLLKTFERSISDDEMNITREKEQVARYLELIMEKE